MRYLPQFVIGVSASLGTTGCDPADKQQQIPAALYAANHCGGPASGWSPQGSEFGELMAHNTLVVGPSKLTWNGVAVTGDTLQRYLESMSQLNPGVNLQVVLDDRTDCHFVNQTRARVSEKLGCDMKGECVEYSEADYQAEASRHIVN